MTTSLASLRRHQPFSPTGAVCAVVALAGWVGGWLLGWTELMVVAAGALLALLVAAPFVVGSLDLHTRRRLEPNRVVVGEHATAVLEVTNRGPRRSAARVIEDRIGDRRFPFEVEALPSGGTTEAIYRLATDRRGTLQVGPAVVRKQDPLGLLRRDVGQTPAQTLHVHPRHVLLDALRAGVSRDLEGPTTDTSPAGDVAFHTIRAYEPGDDPRHVHWLSTARTGTLQVRHYVDNRQPWLVVVLDGRPQRWRGEAFERAVEVVASLMATATVRHERVDLLLGDTGVAATGGHELDVLCGLRPTVDVDLVAAASHAARRLRGASALVVVTGQDSDEDLARLAALPSDVERVVAVRCGDEPAAQRLVLPRLRVVDVHDLDGLRAGWRAIA